jgi:hypothetical protein
MAQRMGSAPALQGVVRPEDAACPPVLQRHVSLRYKLSCKDTCHAHGETICAEEAHPTPSRCDRVQQEEDISELDVMTFWGSLHVYAAICMVLLYFNISLMFGPSPYNRRFMRGV